ncbi:MAG: hypothetical protein M3Y56_09975, partial [Armatimonadota bacterium]|nr:hypothetical protein [Armatimonadota bacterium]
LALVRIRRSGEAHDPVVTLDAAANGGAAILTTRVVHPEELPEGQFRSFTLTFQHPGGVLETRVMWPGSTAVDVDCVDLWEIKPPAATPAP